MADILEITILVVGFLYWPLLYARLRDAIYGYPLTKRKLAAAAVFAVAAASLLVIFNFKLYTYQDPYTLVIPLIALVPVIILAIWKANTRRTKIKLALLAAYLHIFWQVFPRLNIVFIFTDLAGIAAVLAVIKIKKKNMALPKIKISLRRKKKKDKKESGKKETKKGGEKPISLKELWSN